MATPVSIVKVNYTGLGLTIGNTINVNYALAFGIPEWATTTVVEESVGTSLTHTIPVDGTLQVTQDGTTPASGTFVFTLDVPTDEFVRAVTNGNIFKEQTLADLFKQAMILSATVSEGRLSALGQDLDFGGQKALNVGTGTADTDGVNKGQMDTAIADQLTVSGAIQTAAEDARDAAAASEAIATARAAAALVSENAAAASALAASNDADQVALDKIATAADVLLTGLDVDATNADVILTGADVDTTAANVVLTGLDVDETAANVILTGNDAASTAADVLLTGLDVAATNADVITTAANVTAASNAQTAAEAARDATLASFDSFDDRYLGAKTSDPTVDNDGDPLVAGQLYYDSVTPVMKVYTGSVWVAAYVSGTDFLAKANNLSDLASVPTAVSNLGLTIGTNVQAYSAILAGTTASFTSAQETKLSGIATGATANSTDAALRMRSSHTGTQLLSTISDAGTAAALDVGTGANDIPQLNGSGQLPAVDGSLLTGISGGKVLQVVSVSKTDSFTMTSTTFTDVTGFSASITPSSTSSKILVIVDMNWGTNGNLNQGMAQLLRDATPISIGTSVGSRTAASLYIETVSSNNCTNGAIHYLDSPATTSSVTYKMQVKTNVSGRNTSVNRSQTDNDVADRARTASNITLMEIGA